MVRATCGVGRPTLTPGMVGGRSRDLPGAVEPVRASYRGAWIRAGGGAGRYRSSPPAFEVALIVGFYFTCDTEMLDQRLRKRTRVVYVVTMARSARSHAASVASVITTVRASSAVAAARSDASR